MQVHAQIGLTFAEFLSAIVRQDPDVIMVGEIRNQETAQIAAQAALTGRLVLSTLHTNSAAAAVTRLRDMGLGGLSARRGAARRAGAAPGAPALPVRAAALRRRRDELIHRLRSRATAATARQLDAASRRRLPRVPPDRLSRPLRHRRIPAR